MTGLGVVVLTDLMTEGLRASSNFKGLLGHETVISMPAYPCFHTMLPQAYVLETNLWVCLTYIGVNGMSHNPPFSVYQI